MLSFFSPFSLVSVSVEKIGVVVCIVCQTPKTTFNRISNTSNLPNIFRSVFKNWYDLSTFSHVASQLPSVDI